MWVSPHSIVPGRISVSRPIVTSGPIHTCVGSSIVTPAAMWVRLMRSCMARLAWASWMREFTPMSSTASGQSTAAMAAPWARRMPTMSVR